MPILFRILLIFLAIAYLISPFDLIPDMFVPFLGWIDDTFLIGLLIYYLKYGRLPGIFYRKGKQQQSFFQEPGNGQSTYSSAFTGKEQKQNHQARDNMDSTQRESERARSPFDILGVSRNATRQEIQAAYRDAVKRYHPDKVSHLGKEFQDLANKKFIEIKEAYTTLTKD